MTQATEIDLPKLLKNDFYIETKNEYFSPSIRESYKDSIPMIRFYQTNKFTLTL